MAAYTPDRKTLTKTIKRNFRDFRRNFWSLLALSAVMITSCFATFLIFFDNRIRGNIAVLVVVYTCDFIYLFDTIWRVQAFKKLSSKMILHRKIKVFRALTFTLDVLSLIPLEALVMTVSLTPLLGNFHYLNLFAALRANRVLRLYRVPTYYTGKSKELRLILYRKEILGIIVCFFCFLVILVHGSACLWYGLNCTPLWKFEAPKCKGDEKVGNITQSNFLGKHSYYTSAVNRSESDSFGWYVALHWTVMSLRNSGTWYTPPNEALDMAITSFIMLFGYIMCAIITMFLIYILSELDLRRSIFFHEAYAVKSFVKHFDMTKSVAKFSDLCFNFMWRRKRGYADNTMRIILPKAVQIEIAMCMIQPLVEKSEILKLFPEDALQAISLDAVMKHFFANEFLLRPNCLAHICFFIVSGKVEILSESDGVTPILLMSAGSLIGEMNLMFPTIRKNGVKTRTACDIIVLQNTTITQLLKESPDTEEKIREIVKERVTWTKVCMPWRATMLAHQQRERLNTSQGVEIEDAIVTSSSDVGSGGETVSSEKLQEKSETGSFPSESRRHVRRATGTQFMSVLAWLSFLKNERGSTFNEDGRTGDVAVYENLCHKWRSEASNRLYIIDQLKDPPTWLRARWRVVVSSDHLLNRTWEGFVFGIVLFNSILYPFELFVNTPEFCAPINFLVDVIYALDLVIRLFICLQPDELSPLVPFCTHLQRELSRPSILFDAIPIIPLYHAAPLISATYRTQNLLRIHLHVKFARVICMFERFENDVRVRIFTIRFLKNSLYISLYIFWIGMIFYIIGCPTYPNCEAAGTDTWLHLANTSRNYDFDSERDSIFVFALFWAICTTFGIGINEIDLEETAVHSLGLLLGFSMLCYFYADLASTLSGALENAIHHQDNVIWLTRYLDDALIDLRLINRVTRYLDIQWQALRGISSEANRSIGFLTVSHSMYIELVVDYVADFLYRTHLFRHLDTDTMRKFCLAAKLAVVAPNEIIVCHGDFIRRMYVIRRGYIQVYIGDSNTTVGVLVPGHSFGEINMLYGIPSQVTLRSLTYLEVIIIDHMAFDKIVPTSKHFSEAVEVLRKDVDGLSKFQRRFMLQQPQQQTRKRRARPAQTASMSVYKYRKIIKNSKGQVINLRTLKNEPFTREFNKVCCGRYLRFCFMPLTFLPKGQFIRAWELVRVCGIVLSAALVPLVEAFPSLKNEVEHYMYIFDVISMIDMFIRIHTAYHDSANNELITHPLLAAKHYLAGAFLIDFLASFPVYLIINYSLMNTKYETTILSYILRCNRLLLLYRVYGYYKYKDLKIVKGKNTWKMIKLLPLLVYQAHVLACALAVETCPATQKNPNPDPRCESDSWIFQSGAPGRNTKILSDMDIYVISFYYMATTSMSCGFGDYHPYDQNDRIRFAIISFLYIFLRAYILANVLGSKCHMDHKFLAYQKQMNYLVCFLGRERLDHRLASRIIRYYDYQWRRTQGIEPQKLFSNLFPSLRKEVAMDVFEDVLRQLPELKRVPKSFLRAICVYLTPIYFLRHDIIVQKDDVCDFIYFISRGKVLEWRESGEAYLQVGDYIGSMDVGNVRPVYKYTASAVTNVDIFGIRRKDYVRIVNFYPAIAKKFVQQSQFTDAGTMPLTSSKTKSSLGSAPGETQTENSFANKRSESMDVIEQSLSDIVSLVVEGNKKNDKIYGEDYLFATASVLPESPVYRYLDAVTFFAAMVSACVTGYQWSFNDLGYAYFGIAYFMDLIFVIKMAVSFRVSYFDDSGEMVSDSSEIQNKYLSDFRGFGLDFLSTFPVEIFVGSSALQGEKSSDELKRLWAILRINRLLRLIHIWSYFRKRSNSLTDNLVRTKLERLICFTLMYFHFLSCALHGFSKEGNYMSVKECQKNFMVPSKWACAVPQRWFQTKNNTKDFEKHPYVWSMYLVLSTFTTTAYGDLVAVTYFEMIFISFIAFSSLIWFGLALSDLLSGLQNTVDTSYHLAADVVLKMYGDYGVSLDVLEKVVRYFTYAWAHNKGVVVPEFLTRAPACLKMDICTVAYGDHIRASYLFKNLSEEFIRQATIRLRHFWVLAGDFVIRQKEIDSNLYFIHRGYVEYTRESAEGGGSVMEIGYLGRSSFFGEFQCIISPEPHHYSYKAQVNVDIVSLSPGDVQELFELFPQHKETVLVRMAARRRWQLAAQSQRAMFREEENRILKEQWEMNRMFLYDIYDDLPDIRID